MEKLILDHVFAAETAFFSEDQRVSIIRIFEKIKTVKNLSSEKTSVMFPYFSIAGKVTGDYGKGVNIGVVHEDGSEMIKEVLVKAGEEGKPFFNFIVNVTNIILKKGKYNVVVKNEKGVLVGKRNIFEVIE